MASISPHYLHNIYIYTYPIHGISIYMYIYICYQYMVDFLPPVIKSEAITENWS